MVICAIPVFIGQIGRFLGLGDSLGAVWLAGAVPRLGHGRRAAGGSGLFRRLYVVDALFESGADVTASLEKRDSRQSVASQYAVRAVCLGVIATCATAWAGYTGRRFDMTSENLFTLSGSTQEILGGLGFRAADRDPGISCRQQNSIPAEYAETRKRLVGLAAAVR